MYSVMQAIEHDVSRQAPKNLAASPLRGSEVWSLVWCKEGALVEGSGKACGGWNFDVIGEFSGGPKSQFRL